jgi:hypothetical protein
VLVRLSSQFPHRGLPSGLNYRQNLAPVLMDFRRAIRFNAEDPGLESSTRLVLAFGNRALQWIPDTTDHEGDRSMSQLIIHAGDFTFDARFEEQLAPKTCAAFKKAMPFESQVIHVRWSGEGVWMPLGDLDFGVSYENHTSYPAPGQIILYPGGISETEILLAYGGVHFASKMGQLAGNHFITLTSGLENLPRLGKTVLWQGAQKIRFEMV